MSFAARSQEKVSAKRRAAPPPELPGADAAVVRIKETRRALAMSLDGNGRYCYLSPREGAQLAVAEEGGTGRGQPRDRRQDHDQQADPRHRLEAEHDADGDDPDRAMAATEDAP